MSCSLFSFILSLISSMLDSAISAVKFFLRSYGRIIPSIYIGALFFLMTLCCLFSTYVFLPLSILPFSFTGKCNPTTKVTLLVENDEKVLHVLTVV